MQHVIVAHVYTISLCIIFHTCLFISYRLIQLSSPNLNYLIGPGATVFYLNIITFVIPTINTHFAIYFQQKTVSIRASVDALYRDGAREISRDPRTKTPLRMTP